MKKLIKLLILTIIFITKNASIFSMDLEKTDWRTLGYESKVEAEEKIQDEVKENSESSTEKLAKINAYRSKCLEECGLYKDVNGLIQEYDPIEDIWEYEILCYDSTGHALCVLPGNKLASGFIGNTIEIFDLETSKCERILDNEDTVYALCILPGNKLASGSGNIIKIWDLNTNDLNTNEYIKSLKGHKDNVRELYLLSDDRLASISKDDFTIKIWNLNSYKCIKTIEINKFSASILLPGNKLAYSHSDGIIDILDLNNYKHITLKGDISEINSLCLLPHNKLASANYDCDINIWDLDTYECVKTLQCDQNFYFYKLCLLPGNKLASVCSDGTIRIWNLITYQCEVFRKYGIINSLCSLPNNKLAFTNFNHVKILDLATCQHGVLEGHYDHFVESLHLLPNNKLASVCHGVIKIWNNQVCSLNVPSSNEESEIFYV